MAIRYSNTFEPLEFFGKKVEWPEFIKGLRKLIITFRGEDSLEYEIADEINAVVDRLILAIGRATDHMNMYHYTKKTYSQKLIDVVDEGFETYTYLTGLMSDCAEFRDEAKTQDWFIRELFGVNGGLPGILIAIKRIRQWTEEILRTTERCKYCSRRR